MARDRKTFCFFGTYLFVCIEDWERETGTIEVGTGLEPA